MDTSRRRFEVLFRAHYPAVRRYADHRAIAGADADDLVAETFLVAWRRLDVVPEDDPLPWLLAVAANVRRNQARSRRRYRNLVDRVPRPDAAPPPLEPSDNAAAIRAALAALTPDDREILSSSRGTGSRRTRLPPCSARTPARRLRLHRPRNFAALGPVRTLAADTT